MNMYDGKAAGAFHRIQILFELSLVGQQSQGIKKMEPAFHIPVQQARQTGNQQQQRDPNHDYRREQSDVHLVHLM
ncbi:hypothetical protein D3C71_1439740 [compost metagenome]